MYKLLIVDDEYFSREGMRMIIDWSKFGIEIVGMAEDGIEGIEMAKELEPHIILTDIRMKALDGLSMIEELKKSDIRCKFIIMSGYKVFEYAKKALDEGIGFYLLKPVSKETLSDAVVKIINELDSAAENDLHLKYEQSESNMRTLIYNGVDSFEPFKKEIESFFVYQARLALPIRENRKDRMNIYKRLNCHCENNAITFISDSEFVGLIFNGGNSKVAIHEVLEVLRPDMNACIGVGKTYSSIKCFADSKHQAYLALQYRFYASEKNKAFFYEDIQEYLRGIDGVLIGLAKQIINHVEIADKDAVREDFVLVGNRIERNKYIPCNVCDWFLHLRTDTINILRSLEISCDELENFLLEDDMSMAKDWGLVGCINITENFCLQAIAIIENNRRKSISNTIKEVVQYVNRHYTEDITLDQLAKLFFLELSYLSRLFKKETGKAYLSYLTEKRMTKAKELLRNSDMTIYEIATKVSYTDAKYFSQLFKKTEGMVPTEYREALSE